MIPGLVPYLAPYGLFLVLVELEGVLPGAASVLLPAKVVIPGLLVAFFAHRGDYPELRHWPLGWRTLLDVGIGLAIAALWVGPYLVLDGLPRSGGGFDPDVLGEQAQPLALGLRLLGFAVVTPFVEELFVRSFLHRLVDAWPPRNRDFRSLPVGVYTRAGFAITVLWFTFSHVPWEWVVAAPAGVIFNLWLYRRGHLGATIIAHATANAAIFALVRFGPWPLAEFL